MYQNKLPNILDSNLEKYINLKTQSVKLTLYRQKTVKQCNNFIIYLVTSQKLQYVGTWQPDSQFVEYSNDKMSANNHIEVGYI